MMRAGDEEVKCKERNGVLLVSEGDGDGSEQIKSPLKSWTFDMYQCEPRTVFTLSIEHVVVQKYT